MPLAGAHGARTLAALVVAITILVAATPAAARSDRGPQAGRGPAAGRASYIVTLAVPDATRPVDLGDRAGRARASLRQGRARVATDALEEAHRFRASHRFGHAFAGFAARLDGRHVAALAADPAVHSIRPARPVRIASQSVPVGITRVRAEPQGPPGPDVDADVAIVDTGVGPVGGGELDIAGGINCSGDGTGSGAIGDVFAGHGTHVAGIVGARDNGVGVVGVAPGARLWSLRVFGSNGIGSEATVICALDWAIDTHSGTPPVGSQPIEVINMSLEGPRVSGGPEACGVASDPDAMHVAVCAAVAAGMTVVVAAGNGATNARHTSPAGYDQVITVAAMSDFDGLPGSLSEPPCGPGFEPYVDDAWAPFSNFGPDVDLVAPGSCVRSTSASNNGDGDTVTTKTGTSMATPHVSGAAARYLASHPGTSPSAMRNLLRSAGRLDYRVFTDPDWDGPSSSGGPRRNLDVQALTTGGQDLRAWLVPTRLTAAIGQQQRHARVDLQRVGGLADDVTLHLAGLPGSVATSAFDGAGLLSGITSLGQRLTLTMKSGAPDGIYDLEVSAEGPGGTPVASRDLELLVDRTRPVVKDLRASILPGRRVATGKVVTVRVTWQATDALSGIDANRLDRRIGSGAWKQLGAGAKLEALSTGMKPQSDHRYRVRSFDEVGNTRTSSTILRQLVVRDSRAGSIDRSGGWTTVERRSAVGGSFLRSGQVGARLSTSLEGRQVAVVAPVGPDLGRLRVRVDGGTWTSVHLERPVGAPRLVVFRKDIDGGDHLLEVEVEQGRGALDAVLILR